MKKDPKAELDSLQDKVELLIDKGQLGRAETVLQRMLANDRDCLPAHFNLTRVYQRTRQYKRALYHGRRTLRLNPLERNAHLNVGVIYDCMNNYRQAMRYYKKELQLNPGSAETFFNVGRLYFEKGQWSKASRFLAQCFDLGFPHELADTVEKLGLCYYRKRNRKAYIQLYYNYIKMFPRAFWAMRNLGKALLEDQEYKKAVHWLTLASLHLGGKEILEDLMVAVEKLDQATGRSSPAVHRKVRK